MNEPADTRTPKRRRERDRLPRTAQPRPASRRRASAGNESAATDGAGPSLERQREILGLDPAETLTTKRFKELLPLAYEGWKHADISHASQLKRMLRRRFEGRISGFEATLISSVLENTGAIRRPGAWFELSSGGDGDTLFDMMLYCGQQTLRRRGIQEVNDPAHLGKVLLADSVEPSELRMRLLRGRSLVAHQQA